MDLGFDVKAMAISKAEELTCLVRQRSFVDSKMLDCAVVRGVKGLITVSNEIASFHCNGQPSLAASW